MFNIRLQTLNDLAWPHIPSLSSHQSSWLFALQPPGSSFILQMQYAPSCHGTSIHAVSSAAIVYSQLPFPQLILTHDSYFTLMFISSGQTSLSSLTRSLLNMHTHSNKYLSFLIFITDIICHTFVYFIDQYLFL